MVGSSILRKHVPSHHRHGIVVQKIKGKRKKRYLREIIQRVASDDPSVTEIILKDVSLKHEIVTALAMALVGNTHVEVLFLQGNKITSEGAQILASALQSNNYLEHLWLGDNSICSAGATAIATALYKNRTLKSLGLSDNAIGEEGALNLLEAIQKNTSIEGICLEGNNIDEKTLASINQCARNNSERDLTDELIKNLEDCPNPKEKCCISLKVEELMFHESETVLESIEEEPWSDVESCDESCAGSSCLTESDSSTDGQFLSRDSKNGIKALILESAKGRRNECI